MSYTPAELRELADLPDRALAAAFRDVATRDYTKCWASLFRAHVIEKARSLASPPSPTAGGGAQTLDVGFKYENGVHIPTVLVGFAPNDWDARDAFVRSLSSAPSAALAAAQSKPVPSDEPPAKCAFKDVLSSSVAQSDARHTEALRRLLPLIEKALGGFVFTADKAGEVAADMAVLSAALAGVNVPAGGHQHE